MVNTLLDERLLGRDPQRRYVLGEGAAVLAHAYLRRYSSVASAKAGRFLACPAGSGGAAEAAMSLTGARTII